MARQLGGASPYYTAADQTLREYIPLPFQEMVTAGQTIQKRSDDAMNQNLATDALMGSIEAIAPEHKSYVTNQINTYRNAQKSLYDQYNGNMADPEYIRQSKIMNTRFASDPTFKTIMTANERSKVQDKIAAQMSAEGKLFIRPEFKGRDERGNIVDNVGEIRGVNTLGEWGQRLDAASKSMINNNRGTISNKTNLDRASNEIINAVKSGSPEVNDLISAYKQQGMSDEQARVKVANDVVRLRGQYAERTERDNSYYSHQLALRAEARANEALGMQRAMHNAQLAQLTGNKPQTPTQLLGVEDAILKKDINKDRLTNVDNFTKNFIDEKGNLKHAKKGTVISKEQAQAMKAQGIAVEEINPSARGAVVGGRGASETTYRIASDGKLASKFAVNQLAEMRKELGWPSGKGSAKQVADNYKSLMRSDNMAPTILAPTNKDVYEGIERNFGNNISGGKMYLDGKESTIKAEEAPELIKNKQFLGFSTAKQGTGSQGSLKFQSSIDGKTVIYTVPMPSEMQRLFKDNLQLTSAIQRGDTNSQMMKNPSLRIQTESGKNFAPFRSNNGVDYVEVTADGEPVYNKNRTLNVVPANVVQQRFEQENQYVNDMLLSKYSK